MNNDDKIGLRIAGAGAGIINGLFGAGGGMILIPLLRRLTDFEDRQIFSLSIAIILPICLVSLSITALNGPLPWKEAFPYLIGSALGGIAAGIWGRKIPVKWLHRGLGILIVWGGVRYLC